MADPTPTTCSTTACEYWPAPDGGCCKTYERDPAANLAPDQSTPATEPERYERDKDGNVILPLRACPKCGAQAVAFVCDVKDCPVHGGAAYG